MTYNLIPKSIILVTDDAFVQVFYTPINIPGASLSVEQLKPTLRSTPRPTQGYTRLFTPMNQSCSITRKVYLITIDCQLTGTKAVS